jgi:hypothetical protein
MALTFLIRFKGVYFYYSQDLPRASFGPTHLNPAAIALRETVIKHGENQKNLFVTTRYWLFFVLFHGNHRRASGCFDLRHQSWLPRLSKSPAPIKL